jgi:heme-degrading monooxygenase HmoA
MSDQATSGDAAARVVTVFRSRLRGEGAAEYDETAGRMVDIASSMPGLVEVKTFSAEDAERVTLVTFESIESHNAWRDHPEHRQAQRMGRERFYSEYRIVVCAQLYEHSFIRDRT